MERNLHAPQVNGVKGRQKRKKEVGDGASTSPARALKKRKMPAAAANAPGDRDRLPFWND
jgi:hypothetical protein